jgi:hypothetical protein
MSNRTIALLTLFLAFLSVPFTPSAQVLYGSPIGNVTDKTGGAVPNAKVEADNVSTGIGGDTATDDRGVFLILDAQAGTYKLTIGAPAFASTLESGCAGARRVATGRYAWL